MTSQTPAVDQAYREILDRISSGMYRPSSRLPGERQLAEEVGVSRMTLKAGLQRLQEEGWLEASYKRGWFVRGELFGEPPNVLQSFSEMAAAHGATAQSRVLSLRRRPSTFVEARELKIVPSASVVEINRLRSMDRVPICVDQTVIPAQLVPGLTDSDLEDASLYRHLRQAYELHIWRSSYTVEARLADEDLARLLDVTVDSAILRAHEITSDQDQRPLLRATIDYRADAYQFTANLYRS